MLSNTRGSSLIGCGSLLFLAAGFGVSLASGGLVGAVFLLLLLLAVVVLCVGIYERRHWGPVTISFPEWPLRLGHTYTPMVEREAKTRSRERSLAFSGELTCHEVVSFDVGDDTNRERRYVHRAAIAARGELVNNRFTGAIPVHIPIDAGGPTMALDHNEIIWRLELDLTSLSPFARHLIFELQVGPVVGPETTPRPIQDAGR